MTAHKTAQATPPAPFEAPWHGQAFALAVALSEAGHFEWTEWAEAFGAELKRQGAARALDGSDEYYSAWITTLETIVQSKHLAGADQITEMANRWRDAFLTTPHGAPVRPEPLEEGRP